MTVLAAQSIREEGVITPCLPSSKDHRNCSKGLSACGYDLSVAEPVTVHSLPASIVLLASGLALFAYEMHMPPDIWRLTTLTISLIFLFLGWHGVRNSSKLLGAAEYFNMPTDVMARIHDKSSLARRHVYVLNTVAEPGWRGYLTVEVTNMGRAAINFEEGDAIAQAIFERLDKPTEIPYSGKYQDQERGAQKAR